MLRPVLWVKKRNQLNCQFRTINVEIYAKQALHTCCLSCFAKLLSLSFRNFFNNINLCYYSQIFQVQKTFISPATVFYSVTMYSTKDVVLQTWCHRVAVVLEDDKLGRSFAELADHVTHLINTKCEAPLFTLPTVQVDRFLCSISLDFHYRSISCALFSLLLLKYHLD